MAELHIYADDEVDYGALRGKTIAVIGYGNQGRAQSLNLRDSGFAPLVGNVDDAAAEEAKRDGFQVLPIAEAARRGDILFLLLPDEVAPEVFGKDVEPGLRTGNILCFASGYNITFGFVRPPETVDLVLLAPRMIGRGVRDLFVQGRGAASLIAVRNDASGQARQVAMALSKALGYTRGGLLESTFEEETVLDLFSEQVLGGMYLHMIRMAYETLVEAGVSPAAALLELYASGEGGAGARATSRLGIWNQLRLHSTTSQYGQQTRGPMLIDEHTRETMRQIMSQIQHGEFAREWTLEQQGGKPVFNAIWRRNLEHPMLRTEDDVYRFLGRR